MYNPAPIFKFAAGKQRCGVPVVLITIVAVSGGSTRSAGCHMAVAEDGSFAGSLSGGCIERAVVAEALEALGERRNRTVRYGQGSRYIDLRLPCGGSVDLHFVPIEDMSLGNRIADCFANRQPVELEISLSEPRISLNMANVRTGLRIERDIVCVGHAPPLQIALFGTGDTVDRVRDLALLIDADVYVASPDAELVNRSRQRDVEAHQLRGLSGEAVWHPDRWTAIALLFHDHDWEIALLKRHLASEAFYIGAMGSRITHERRVTRLAQSGVAPQDIARIRAPIGLIPSMRDPETLAVSVLAQIIEAFNASFLASK